MYSCEQDHRTAAARATFSHTTGGYQPCAAPAAHRRPGQRQVLPAAAAALQPRRAKNKKPGASRRSSTTVVATDVNNFRAMVQELTGFPPAAIFRPLPRRVHATSPFVAAGAGQGCSASERRGHGGSEAANTSTTTGGGGRSPDDAPAAQPAVLQMPPLGVFDELADLGSPEFDSWGDLSIE